MTTEYFITKQFNGRTYYLTAKGWSPAMIEAKGWKSATGAANRLKQLNDSEATVTKF